MGPWMPSNIAAMLCSQTQSHPRTTPLGVTNVRGRGSATHSLTCNVLMSQSHTQHVLSQILSHAVWLHAHVQCMLTQHASSRDRLPHMRSHVPMHIHTRMCTHSHMHTKVSVQTHRLTLIYSGASPKCAHTQAQIEKDTQGP